MMQAMAVMNYLHFSVYSEYSRLRQVFTLTLWQIVHRLRFQQLSGVKKHLK